MPAPSSPPPLQGIRIVDFSRYLPGPCCTLHLHWLGASVTAIEQPPDGDPMRAVPPLAADGTSLASWSLGRGKQRMLLDLTDPEDRARAATVIADADVVVESFRPGVAERLGIGPAALCGQHPQLVYCSISGFGQDGPWAQTPGHDANYLAVAGLLDRTGTVERPQLAPIPMADLAGASIAATAICAALLRRERSGVGAHIDVSLTEAALALQVHTLPAAADESGGRSRGMLNGDLACYNLYACSDGEWIAVSALEPKFFQRTCELLGVPELTPLQFEAGRQRELKQRMGEAFASRSSREWAEVLEADDTCCTGVRDAAHVSQHPQLRARKAVEQLDDAAGADCLGPVLAVRVRRTASGNAQP